MQLQCSLKSMMQLLARSYYQSCLSGVVTVDKQHTYIRTASYQSHNHHQQMPPKPPTPPPPTKSSSLQCSTSTTNNLLNRLQIRSRHHDTQHIHNTLQRNNVGNNKAAAAAAAATATGHSNSKHTTTNNDTSTHTRCVGRGSEKEKLIEQELRKAKPGSQQSPNPLVKALVGLSLLARHELCENRASQVSDFTIFAASLSLHSLLLHINPHQHHHYHISLLSCSTHSLSFVDHCDTTPTAAIGD
jgi:hypothetical protein